jgi:hypothetical protein
MVAILMKKIDHKNPEKAMALEKTEQWKQMSLNHLEGRTAAFFCYRDEGTDEMDETGRPKIFQHKNYFYPAKSHLKMKGTLMLHWFGNARMVALKYLIIFGNTAQAAKEKNTVTTRQRT